MPRTLTQYTRQADFNAQVCVCVCEMHARQLCDHERTSEQYHASARVNAHDYDTCARSHLICHRRFDRVVGHIIIIYRLVFVKTSIMYCCTSKVVRRLVQREYNTSWDFPGKVTKPTTYYVGLTSQNGNYIERVICYGAIILCSQPVQRCVLYE